MAPEIKSSAHWKRCGVCKRDIGFDKLFYECSVSTCNTGKHPPAFCSINCWNQHVPVMRHRDAWADQKRSPTRAEWESDQNAGAHDDAGAREAAVPPPVRRMIIEKKPEPAHPPKQEAELEILVVASKVKAYVRARSGMNTSDAVMEKLSDMLRDICDKAIDHARFAGRKTVMDRDFTDRVLP
ncbi:MAG TPA: hypothetical protein VEL28_15795 [Candidatus Binatia bacterium]|nr:hypothetical protein [Candidatus Binatia bacterium]